MSVGSIILQLNPQLWHELLFLQRRVKLNLAMKHRACGWVGWVMEKATWRWRRLLGWIHSRKARCVRRRQLSVGGEDSVVVGESATCEGRTYWQVPLAQGLLGGLGRQIQGGMQPGNWAPGRYHLETSIRYWSLGKLQLLILLLTCSSSQ